jgi:hypothetical protein
MGKREFLTPRQVLEAGNLIDGHCRLIEGFAVYDDGWSDRRIADQMKVRTDFIHNHRRKLIGNLQPVPPAEVKKTLLEKMAAQQLIVDALMQWAAERPVNPFRRPGQGQLDLKIVKSS